MENNKWGKKIKKLRQKLELSRDDFARKANVSYTTLTKIETGVIKKPSFLLLTKSRKH